MTGIGPHGSGDPDRAADRAAERVAIAAGAPSLEFAAMDVRVLGGLEVLDDGRPVDVGSRKQRALLAILVLELDRVVAADRIADLLWIDAPDDVDRDRSRAALQTYISRLRSRLEPARAPRGPSSVLVSQPPGYRLALGRADVDLFRFEDDVAAGLSCLGAGDLTGARERLSGALGRWRGPLLPEFADEPFTLRAAERAASLRLDAVEGIADATLRLGDAVGCVGFLDIEADQHPARERLQAHYALGLYRCGRQTEALRAIDRCRRALRDVNGVMPGPELQRLEADMLAHADSLSWHDPSPVAVQPAVDDGSAPAPLVPVGTVTFLLTDIEQSAAHWQVDPQRMADAMTLHDEILRAAIAGAGGQRSVDQGDGESMVAVFSHARDALAAAVTAQRELQRDVPRLAVRMAVHTGDALLHDRRTYVGPAVVRCARVRACAHGGQVLVSDATAAVVGEECPAGATLVEAGLVRLRGSTRPERVWQIVHPELRVAFPAPRDLEPTPTNVPAPANSLIGRRGETEDVLGLLHGGRVVTLTGAGGCGKTRLAQHVALGSVSAFRGGVWWVELAPVSQDAEVADRARTTLSPSAPASTDVVGDVARHLAAQGPVLLVLDNAEHVRHGAATLVAELVRRCPELTVLITSREPLGTLGEHVFTVPSLAVPARGRLVRSAQLSDYDGARLFVERATQLRPGFVVKDEAVEHVVSICARLDGIPLAIELAAARTRAMPLDRLAAGLDDAFRLLTGGATTALARQQTLLASIAWSVDLLDDRERTALFSLAVFHRPFALDAAEWVAADGTRVHQPDVLDLLQQLVDKSLLQYDAGSERYRMLETVRQFAFERLRDRHELAAARDRHAAWYAHWSEDVGGGRRGLDFSASHPDMTDVIAALDWSMEVAPNLAYRIMIGLGCVRDAHYQHLEMEKAWIEARTPPVDRGDDPIAGAPAEVVLWARAAASLNPSAIPLQWDLGAMNRRVRELIEPDAATTRMLEFGDAFASALGLADRSLIDRHLRGAWDDGDLTAYHLYASAATAILVQLGPIDECVAIATKFRARCAALGLPFDAANGVYAWYVLALMEQGRLAEATELARVTTGRDSFYAVQTLTVSMLLADATGDPNILERFVESLDTEQPPQMEDLRDGTRGLIAGQLGRNAEALDVVRPAVDALPFPPVLIGHLYQHLVVMLIRAGDVDGARQYASVLAADAARFPWATVAHARASYAMALVARGGGRYDEMRRHIREAISEAVNGGLTIRLIDALELVAEDDDRRGDSSRAAAVLGATTAARQAVGYAGSGLPDPDTVRERALRLRSAEPDAWLGGTTTPLVTVAESFA